MCPPCPVTISGAVNRTCLQYLDVQFGFLQLKVIFLTPSLFCFFHVRYGVYLDQTLVNQLVYVLFGCHSDAQCFPCNQNTSSSLAKHLTPQPSLKRLEEPSLATTFKGVYLYLYLLPLHVSALVGHLQAEYTNISGSYFT
jgi:hypothetical protein